jgi:hypothetical protein
VPGTMHIAIYTNPYRVAITAVGSPAFTSALPLSNPERGVLFCPSEWRSNIQRLFRTWRLVAVLAVVTMIAADASFATCTGSDPFNACKNCKYCAHCAKARWEVRRLQVIGARSWFTGTRPGLYLRNPGNETERLAK